MTMKRSMIYNLLAQGSVFVFGLFNAVLSAQVLGTEGKGQLAIYLLAIDMGIVLLILGLSQALQYYASREEFRGPKTINTALVYSLGCAVVFGVMVQTMFWLGQGSRVLPQPFDSNLFRVLITVHFLHQFFGHLIIAVINSHKLFVQTSKIQMASVAFTLAMYAGLFLVHRTGTREVFANSFYFALATMAITRIGMAVFVYFKHVHRGVHRGTAYRSELLDFTRVRILVAFGVFPWISTFMIRGVLKADFWFVEHFEGLDSLGLYSVASNLGETLYLLPNTLGLVLLSFVADPETRERSTERTATIARLFFVTMIVGAVAFSPFSSWFFGFAFGPDFRDSGPIFNLLLWGIVPYSLATVLIGFLTGANQVRHILVAASAGLILTLALDVLLVPRFGMAGAAGARGVALNVMTWYLVIRFHRTTGIKYRDFLFPKAADLGEIARLMKKEDGP